MLLQESCGHCFEPRALCFGLTRDSVGSVLADDPKGFSNGVPDVAIPIS